MLYKEYLNAERREAIQTRVLVVHPSRDSVSGESCSESQARRAHGEVADEIPKERDNLSDGRQEGQDSVVELVMRTF